MKKYIIKWFFIIFCFFVIPTKSSMACKCAPATPAEVYDRADYIFEGTVIDIEKSDNHKKNQWGESEIKVRVIVTKNWKGLLGKSEVSIQTYLNRQSCYGYNFELQKKYMFFSKKTDALDEITISYCSIIPFEDKGRFEQFREYYHSDKTPK